jgi:hypothetical protein
VSERDSTDGVLGHHGRVNVGDVRGDFPTVRIGLATVGPITAGELVGRWTLTTWIAADEAGAVTTPFGEHPQGCLIYTAGGWMSAQLAVANRAELATATALGGAEGERAAAYSSYVAYCGEYWLERDVVVHRVRMSLYPNWVGREQLRFVELSGDRLVLRTASTPVGGQTQVHRVLWIRAE